MKHLITLLLLYQLSILAGCATFTKQEGLPAMSQIDDWVNNNQYGLALTSLEHIPPSEKFFADYISKRKTVMNLATSYEQTVLINTQKSIDKENWADAIRNLNIARNNYPNSTLIHDRYNVVINKQQKRIHKLDAKSLLARAKLLYNKLPISQKDVSNSPINFAAHWDLQNMKSELSDMHTRLMAMTEQLLDDNEIILAEMCVKQARILTNDVQTLTTIKTLQEKIDIQKKQQLNTKKQQLNAAKKIIAEEELRANLSVQKKSNRTIKQLIKTINHLLKNNELINADKQLSRLSRLAPDSNDLLRLKIKHREKVDKLVYQLTEQGNRLYRQEKIASAKKVWQTALKLDPKNKTLQVQIRRASKVLMKLEELRTKSTAVRQ